MRSIPRQELYCRIQVSLDGLSDGEWAAFMSMNRCSSTLRSEPLCRWSSVTYDYSPRVYEISKLMGEYSLLTQQDKTYNILS